LIRYFPLAADEKSMIFVAVFPLKRLSPIPLPVFEALGRVALAIARSRASATRATRARTLTPTPSRICRAPGCAARGGDV
jgi:hypothetical protein